MRVSTEHLQMLQYRIDIISNNIANINTPGFKEGLLFIEESYNPQERSLNVAQYGGVMPGIEAPEINRNMYVGKRIDFRQGAIYESGNPFDMAILGEGFFQVKTVDGKLGYTRAGLFSPDALGNLVNNEGMLLEPAINIPSNAVDIVIKSDGTVNGTIVGEETDGETEEEVLELGRLSLYKFNNPEGMEQFGHNVFLPTEASGPAVRGDADSAGYGVIKSGMLEKSNTDIVNAMTKIIEAQRAYQFDMRITKDQDEMVMQAIAIRG